VRRESFAGGSAKLDSFLKGGIETQAITEIAGLQVFSVFIFLGYFR